MKMKKSQQETYIAIGAIILVALAIYYYSGGSLFSIAIEGGQTQFSVGQAVPLEWKFTNSEYDYLGQMQMTCNDLKGSYYVFISDSSGGNRYDMLGNKLSGNAKPCIGYPSANTYFCADIIPFNAVSGCTNRLVSFNEVGTFLPRYTGNYLVNVVFVSSTKNQIIFPYNVPAVVRQYTNFNVVAATATPTPTATSTSTPTSTYVPYDCRNSGCQSGYNCQNVYGIYTCIYSPTPAPTYVPNDCRNMGCQSGYTCQNVYGLYTCVYNLVQTATPTITSPTPTEVISDCRTTGCSSGQCTSTQNGYSCLGGSPNPTTNPSVSTKCQFYEKKNTDTKKCENDYTVIGVLGFIGLLIFVIVIYYARK